MQILEVMWFMLMVAWVVILGMQVYQLGYDSGARDEGRHQRQGTKVDTEKEVE